jgi:hypothetical protein
MKDVVLELPKAELDKLIGTLQQVNQVLHPFPHPSYLQFRSSHHFARFWQVVQKLRV